MGYMPALGVDTSFDLLLLLLLFYTLFIVSYIVITIVSLPEKKKLNIMLS
jgi:hypothetical protein